MAAHGGLAPGLLGPPPSIDREKPPPPALALNPQGSGGAWIPPDSLLGPMILTVKLLLGRRCSLKVSGQESVAMLKKLVSERLQVPEEQQYLLFRGQRLADDKCLSDYCIGPNASINVIIRPLAKTAAAEASQPQPLWHRLGLVLAKHFTPHDTKAVLQLLRREHQERLQRISLGALEQLVRDLLMEAPLVEPTAEEGPEAETSEPQDKEEEEEE
uniref:ubiquitin-like protein 4B n=1 Tax=Halichoerus grypus TaxID=9711 RepID=UPI001659E36A